MGSARRESAGTKEDDSETSFPELLNFAGRVQTLISELLLLSSRIPPEFRDHRYDPVLFDLRYFDSPADFEKKIQGNTDLEALEDQLRESCSIYMKRYFLLANGIVGYYEELLRYLNGLHEGTHTQSSLDRVLGREKGKQLLAESLALFGCLLLLLEHHMSGYLREKLLIAHVRYDGCSDSLDLDAVCLLCRVHLPTASSTVHQVQSSPLCSSMVSVQRPEEILLRFPFPNQVVESVINHLKDCDLYNQTPCYPDPKHRSVALATQAGYVYIMLLYSPEYLHNAFLMQEIVDMFFKDAWVVPIFMYYMVDLSFSWDAYKEAKASLSSCLSPPLVNDLCQHHCSKVKDLMSVLSSALSEDVLSRDYVLNNIVELLSVIRNCNFSLRWLLLHRSSHNQKVRDIVTSALASHHIKEEFLILFLLKTSQFEFEVKQLYRELLEDKEALWLVSQQHASDCLQELSKYNSGSWALSWKVQDASLKDWFETLAMEVCSLDHADFGHTCVKLHDTMSTLKDVEQLFEIEENHPIKLKVAVIQKCLQNMLQALNLNEDMLLIFSAITDATFSWGFIGNFTEILFKMIEEDSSIVFNVRHFLLKFRSLLDAPLLRLSQSKSPDLPFVSSYYSSEYMALMCAMLEIVPVMLFRILNDDVAYALQSFLPLKCIEIQKLQDSPMPVEQFHLMKAFNQISVFSQAVKVLSGTNFGLEELNVKNWIEAKMQKELRRKFEDMLTPFFLSLDHGREQLEMNMQKATTFISSQLQMMEVCQDLMHVHGINIWEDEFTSFLKHCAQKECDNFSRRRKKELMVMDSQLLINNFSNAQTFLGNLLHQVLKLTNPSRSMFIEPMCGWFDAEGCELLGLQFFDLLESCIGPVGMASFDSLLAFVIVDNLGIALRSLRCLLDTKSLEKLQMLDDTLGPATSLPLLGWSSYKQMVKFVEIWEPWVESLACIGQLQLLRFLIQTKLKSVCKVKAGLLSSAFDSMVTSVTLRREKILQCTPREHNEKSKNLFHALSMQGMLCGSFSSLQTHYISEEPFNFLGRCASVVTISQLPRYILDGHLGTLTSRMKKDSLDFSPLVWGLGTFLRQFHPSFLIQYVQYMGQYIRLTAEAAFGTGSEPVQGSASPTSEVSTSTFWLMYFCKHMGVPEDLVNLCLPPSLLAVLQA